MRIVACLLIIIITTSGVWAKEKMVLVTNESWSDHFILEGKPDEPIVLSPPPKLQLSDNARKIVVIPEEIKLKEELQEFRMFRNRYVIFGIYIFSALYYNWLTRHR